MEENSRIHEKIQAYHGEVTGPHHRYRSWEHCFRYFHRSTPEAVAADRDCAALQLGFYLASWGMYRGSGFLLQHAYTIHLAVVDQLVAPEFSILWKQEFGSGDNDSQLAPIILKAFHAVREGYKPQTASDTLATKVLLGTFGCLPACDQYFLRGFKTAGFRYSYVNVNFIEHVLQFCKDHLWALRGEQEVIENTSGVRYPLMKLIDMYFWQTGFENSRGRSGE